MKAQDSPESPPAPPPPPDGENPAEGRLSRYSAVTENRRIHRSQIKNAPYNPRAISDKAKKKLRENIKRVGLIDLPIWNKRTGHIVGGHQRMSALDALEGTSDYDVMVTVVDLDEKTEKEQNIILNNPEVQGYYDLDKLGAMFKEGKIEGANTGFDDADIFQMFGGESFEGQQEKLDAMAEKIKATLDLQKIATKAATGRDERRFYIVVVFDSDRSCLQFLDDCGLKHNRYVNGKDLINYIWGETPEENPGPPPEKSDPALDDPAKAE